MAVGTHYVPIHPEYGPVWHLGSDGQTLAPSPRRQSVGRGVATAKSTSMAQISVREAQASKPPAIKPSWGATMPELKLLLGTLVRSSFFPLSSLTQTDRRWRPTSSKNGCEDVIGITVILHRFSVGQRRGARYVLNLHQLRRDSQRLRGECSSI